MESNFQNKTNYQNFEGKGFRQESNQFYDSNYENSYKQSYNKTKYEGNKGVNYGYDKKNESNNYGYFDKQNSSNFYNKMQTNYSNKEADSLENGWGSRYARRTMNWNYIWEEDKKILDEHLDQIRKKKSFDQNFLEGNKLKTYFHGKEINESSPLKCFSELSLNEKLMKNIENMGFDAMTPIQRAVLPYILKGSDTIGCAQTGSGKTVSFLAPIINKMLIDGPPKTDSQLPKSVSAPVALIIVPTRELAEQIYKEARKVLHKTGILAVKVYGGIPIDTQIKHIVNGCDILVATPGRLIDFLKRNLIYLNSVQYLVFDEADRMLDMGFEDQLREIVFCSDIPPKEKRINLMFSATFDKNIREIANIFMNDYFFISKELNQDNTANENIKQELVYSDENEKVMKLHQILQKINGCVLIFLDTKKGVDRLSYFLNKRNYNTTSIHGDKSQDQRQNAINCFSKGDIPILIATDVASRGLDFPNVPYVINYDLPSNIDDYIHRIGRTGRCGNEGTAISFINENCRITKDLYKLLKKSNQTLPEWFEDLNRKADYSSSFSYKKPNNYNKYGSTSGSNYNRNEFGNNQDVGVRRPESFKLNEQPKLFFNSSLNNNPGINSESGSNQNSTNYASNSNYKTPQNQYVSSSSYGGFGGNKDSTSDLKNFNVPSYKPQGGYNKNQSSSKNYYGEEKFSRANYEN